jgi:hypothetical protein
VVRPGEIGSAAVIEQAASAHGAVIHDTQEAQFRCAGSTGFASWTLEHALVGPQSRREPRAMNAQLERVLVTVKTLERESPISYQRPMPAALPTRENRSERCRGRL